MELLVDPISNYPKKHYKIANKILCGGGGGGGGFLWKLYFRTLLSNGLTLQNQAQKNPTPLLTQSAQIWKNPFSK